MLRMMDVLDKGYARLVSWLPYDMVSLVEAIEAGDIATARALLGKDDLARVNAAYASFMKEATDIGPAQHRLLSFLTREGHTSPSRHGVLTLEIKAPLMVARQWHKYRVGGAHGPDSAELLGVPDGLLDVVMDWLGTGGDDWGFDDPLYARNEASRRYITLEPEFYIPGENAWRGAPANRKQGSEGVVQQEAGAYFTRRLAESAQRALLDYQDALAEGVAPEQARLFLPAYALYTVWRWTASVQAVQHFLAQRLAHDAQSEIQQYASVVLDLVSQPQVYTLAFEASYFKKGPA